MQSGRAAAQQRRQKPHDAQQRAPQPPQPQPRQPPQRQPPQPRQPPQRQPQAICWKPALPPFSLSKRWKVARLTSAISSSPSKTDWVGEVFSCGVSAVGRADAEAPPASEKVNPAAPNAGTAALVTRFRLEACFDIVASPPITCKSCSRFQPSQSYAETAVSRKAVALTNVLLYIQFLFILMNVSVSLRKRTECDFATAVTSVRACCDAGLWARMEE
jgi:hypothetical protein